MVAPSGIAATLTTPAAVLPVGGPMALSDDPEPETDTTVLPPVHVVPFESTVITPCTHEVPTVTWEPPLMVSGVQPVGSRSHSAGGLPVAPVGRTVAERPVVELETPRILENIAASLVLRTTRMRWHWDRPSLRPAPPHFESAISVAGTG